MKQKRHKTRVFALSETPRHNTQVLPPCALHGGQGTKPGSLRPGGLIVVMLSRASERGIALDSERPVQLRRLVLGTMLGDLLLILSCTSEESGAVVTYIELAPPLVSTLQTVILKSSSIRGCTSTTRLDTHRHASLLDTLSLSPPMSPASQASATNTSDDAYVLASIPSLGHGN